MAREIDTAGAAGNLHLTANVSRFAAVASALALTVCGCAAAPHSAVNQVPIVFTTAGDPNTGVLGGMVVPVEHLGRAAALAIDTGSALTFLYLGREGPEFVPHAGEVRIGTERLALPGRNLEAEDETGAGIVGVLGADFFTAVATDFDPVAGTITRYLAAAPPRRHGWTTIPFENVGGHIILRLTVDGRSRRLMWDTGSPHILLVGETGRPGDEEAFAMDVEGSRFPIYVGTAQVLLGEDAHTLTILRAPSFPYFRGTVDALGGGIDGLAGQSVFGRRCVLFDPAAGKLHVAPREVEGPPTAGAS